MFDILDFIDSEDIRKFNQNTLFYPLEKAVLIYYSHYTSVEKKLAAWKELLDTYTESEFEYRDTVDSNSENKMSIIPNNRRSNKEILADNVQQYERALRERDKSSPSVLYQACIGMKNGHIHKEISTTYSNAYEYITVFLSGVDDFSEYPDICIDVLKLDGNGLYHECDSFEFNFVRKKLVLTNIFYPNSQKEDWGMETFFVRVPLPFKKGDIVRFIYPSDTITYGVIEDDMDEFFSKRQISTYDGSDMTIWPFTFTKTKDGYQIFDPDVKFLYFERCSREELPDDQKILADFSDVCLGKMGYGLFLMTHFSQ